MPTEDLSNSHLIDLKSIRNSDSFTSEIPLSPTNLPGIETSHLKKEDKAKIFELIQLGQNSLVLAHDLKNVLFTLQAYFDLSLAAPLSSQKSRTNLMHASNILDQISALVHQIGKRAAERSDSLNPISLGTFFEKAMAHASASFPAERVKIGFVNSSTCSTILGDICELHRMISNLFQNAIESMEGQVTKRIEVRVDDSSDEDDVPCLPAPYVRIRVKDSGAGIEKQILKKIFTSFFTTKKSQGGTGLGLTIVQDVITQHHGLLRVDSTLGQGTCFTIFLPSCPL